MELSGSPFVSYWGGIGQIAIKTGDKGWPRADRHRERTREWP